jgi:ribonuclease HII
VRTIFTDAQTIDEQGVGQCLYSAIQEGLDELIEYTGIDPKSVFVYLDGALKAPRSFRQQTVKGGDNKIFSIALASIYAKVSRDKVMEQYDIRYPAYDFYSHKGYGTVAHMKSIKVHGPCPIHRRSFLKKVLAK